MFIVLMKWDAMIIFNDYMQCFIYSQFCQGGVRVALKIVTVLRQHTFSSQFHIRAVTEGAFFDFFSKS